MDELEENDVELESEPEPEPEFESDKEVRDAVRILLEGIGEDCEREGLKRTPHRVAKAFREGTKGTSLAFFNCCTILKEDFCSLCFAYCIMASLRS